MYAIRFIILLVECGFQFIDSLQQFDFVGAAVEACGGLVGNLAQQVGGVDDSVSKLRLCCLPYPLAKFHDAGVIFQGFV